MAHKTMVDGTAYEIKGGRTLVDGAAYDIKKGRTLVDGTAYDIGFGCTVTLSSSTIDGAHKAYVSINGGTEFPTDTGGSDQSMIMEVPEGSVCECFFRPLDSNAEAPAAVYLNGVRVAYNWNPDYFDALYTYTINKSVKIEVKTFGLSLSDNLYGEIYITE